MEQYTFVGFLIMCVLGLSIFVRYLVIKLISLTEKNTTAFNELKHAISKLELTLTLQNK